MDFLTTSEAAAWFGVSPATIRVWAYRDKIMAVRDRHGELVRHPDTGERVYRLIDVARQEKQTRKRARR